MGRLSLRFSSDIGRFHTTPHDYVALSDVSPVTGCYWYNTFLRMNHAAVFDNYLPLSSSVFGLRSFIILYTLFSAIRLHYLMRLYRKLRHFSRSCTVHISLIHSHRHRSTPGRLTSQPLPMPCVSESRVHIVVIKVLSTVHTEIRPQTASSASPVRYLLISTYVYTHTHYGCVLYCY